MALTEARYQEPKSGVRRANYHGSSETIQGGPLGQRSCSPSPGSRRNALAGYRIADEEEPVARSAQRHRGSWSQSISGRGGSREARCAPVRYRIADAGEPVARSYSNAVRSRPQRMAGRTVYGDGGSRRSALYRRLHHRGQLSGFAICAGRESWRDGAAHRAVVRGRSRRLRSGTNAAG